MYDVCISKTQMRLLTDSALQLQGRRESNKFGVILQTSFKYDTYRKGEIGGRLAVGGIRNKCDL